MGKEWVKPPPCKHRSTRTTISEQGDEVVTTVTCTDECGQQLSETRESK